MTTHRELELVGYFKSRFHTGFYCRGCRREIGMIHRRPLDYDYFNPDLCVCNRGLIYDLTLDEVVDHFRPALNYLKPLPFSIKRHDIGRVVRVRSKVESGVVT